MKQHLLRELELKFPNFNLSYSNSRFISMKCTRDDIASLSSKKVIYSLRVARFVQKLSDISSARSFEKVKDGEYWEYETIEFQHDFLRSYPPPEPPEEAPARAYGKVEEAHRLFQLELFANQSVIEIGSAPGGITYYLLNLGLQVLSIDPANMDTKLTEDFPNQFTHLKNSIFDIKKKHLPKEAHWLVSDLNLDGKLNIDQSVRIMKMYPKMRGAFLTLKTPKTEDVKRIDSWIKKVPKDYKVEVCNLPSHRKEVGFIIQRI